MPYFVYQDELSQWRWRFRASDNTLIAQSISGYATKDDCLRSIDSIRSSTRDSVIPVSTKLYFDAEGS